MRKYFVVSRWWDTTMGWWLWLRRRPRCTTSPFDPAPTGSADARSATTGQARQPAPGETTPK